MTLTQLAFKPRTPRTPRATRTRTPRLRGNPQRRGVVTRVVTRSPKKPNSATRHVAKVRLAPSYFVTVRLPGSGM
jgi:small subunit ribosomal protein S12